MKNALAGLAVTMGVALAGCTVAEKPVGTAPANLVAAEWNGIWTTDGDQALVEVIDGAKGLLRLSDVKKEKADEPLDVELRLAHGVMFYNLQPDDEDSPELGKSYLWGRVERTGNKVRVSMPDTDKFTELVKTGRLTGKVDEVGNVTLQDLTDEQIKAIATGAFGNIWSDETMEFEKAK